MRWLLGRDPGSCEACGAELERGAPWCGGCGARTDGADPDTDQPVVATESDTADEGIAAPPPRWARHRQWVIAVLVLAVVAAAVAAQPRAGPPEPLLGQLEQRTGMSATGPPPSGLRLAWAHDPPEGSPSHRSISGPPQRIIVRDGRVVVGSHVVELESGQLVRVAAGGTAAAAEWAMVEAGELVVLDTVTGEVRHRAAVSGEWQHRSPWSIQRVGGVSMFGTNGASVLVRDDGSVAAEVDGQLLGGVDRALEDPEAFPLRDLPAGEYEPFTAPVRLVAVATGEVVLDLADDRVRVVDVIGDLAMVAETDARVDAVTSPAATSAVTWTVRLLDARTGAERARLDVDAHEPPRMLGTFGDGTAVIATRSGDELPLQAVAPDGSISTIARAQSAPRRTDTGVWPESRSLNAAAVTDDVLVVSAGDDGLVGLDRAGRALWTLEAPTFAGLRADGGHLAVLPDDGGRIRVVRAADGEVVASLPTRAPQWDVASTPRAALADHVGLGPGDSYFAQEEVLGSTTWLDLRTGEPATLEEVFAPFLPADPDRVDRSWLLHGTVTTDAGQGATQPGGSATQTGGSATQPGGDATQPDGVEGVGEAPADRIEPVLTRSRPGGVLELLEPGEGVTQFPLPVPQDVALVERGIRSLGATAERLAVQSEGFDGPGQMAVHVLDRTSGDVTTMQGLRGHALIGDVLLAAEIDDTWTTISLVGMDAATGQERWSGPPLDGFRGFLSPRVDHELVVELGVARVAARSLRDGAQVWTHASDSELTDHSVLGSRHVVVATTTGEVVALDRTDGEVAWRTPVGIPVASLTGAGDHVLVGTHDGLVVHLDGRGREVQRLVVGSGPVEAVAAFGDTVVATVDERVVGLRADGTGITRDDEVELP